MLCPTFILHGIDDNIIPYSHSQLLQSKSTGYCKLKLAADMNHTEFHFMEDFIKPLRRFLDQIHWNIICSTCFLRPSAVSPYSVWWYCLADFSAEVEIHPSSVLLSFLSPVSPWNQSSLTPCSTSTCFSRKMPIIPKRDGYPGCHICSPTRTNCSCCPCVVAATSHHNVPPDTSMSPAIGMCRDWTRRKWVIQHEHP